MTTLDQFLKDMEAVQVCLENMEGMRESAPSATYQQQQQRLGSALSQKMQQ